MLQLSHNVTAPFGLRAGYRLVAVSAGEKLHVPRCRRYFHRSQSRSSYSYTPTDSRTPIYGHTPTWGPITVLDQYAASQQALFDCMKLTVV